MFRATPPSEPYDRQLRLAGTRNLRDIGGYPAGAGRQTRWRTLFRADALDRLPVDSQAALIGLGLRQAIDLRFPNEVEAWPSVFRDSPAVRYVSLPLHDDRPAPPGGVAAGYREILDSRGAQFAAVGHALLEPEGLPAVVGCAAGIDRTGLTIALILSAVGVPPEVVAADYALSAASFAGDGRESGLGDWRSGPVRIDCLPEYMLAALDHLATKHGGATAFLARHGLAATDIARLRKLLTEPTDDEAGDRAGLQLLTTVSTLVVAVAGFYFGSRAVAQGAKTAAAAQTAAADTAAASAAGAAAGTLAGAVAAGVGGTSTVTVVDETDVAPLGEDELVGAVEDVSDEEGSGAGDVAVEVDLGEEGETVVDGGTIEEDLPTGGDKRSDKRSDKQRDKPPAP